MQDPRPYIRTDDETEVVELSTQPFVLEQLYVSLNKVSDLPTRLARIRHVLIDGFDAVAAGCIDLDYARQTTVLYRSPEWAQKQAQVLWDQAAQTGKLDAVRGTRFLPFDGAREAVYEVTYDVVYFWIPFADYEDRDQCMRALSAVTTALPPGGLAFVVGPSRLGATLPAYSMRLLDSADVKNLLTLPLLQAHLRLHPRTRLNETLAVFLIEKQ